MRTISEDFKRDLKDENYLKPLVDYVRDKDNKVVLCIREKYINIYYKAHSLFKISELGEHRYKFEFDLNHARYTCNKETAKQTVNEIYKGIKMQGSRAVFILSQGERIDSAFLQLAEQYKKYIDDFFDVNIAVDYFKGNAGPSKKSALIEKIQQQNLYMLSMAYTDNGYVCYDRETAIEGKEIEKYFPGEGKLGQPDSMYARIENGVITELLLVEVKSEKSACRSTGKKDGSLSSGLKKHNDDFEKMLSRDELKYILREQARETFNTYGDIGLNGFPSEIKMADKIKFGIHYIFTDNALEFKCTEKSVDYLTYCYLRENNKIYYYRK